MQDDSFKELIEVLAKNLASDWDDSLAKKIRLTIDAIDKVPFVHFGGLTEQECMDVRGLEQDLLEYSMLNNNSDECAAILRLDKENFDSDDERKDFIEGTITKVHELGKHPLMKSADGRVAVISHNHPNDTFLSVDDAFTFLRYKQIKLMTAVSNEGSLEAISRTPKFQEREVGEALFVTLFALAQKELVCDADVVSQTLDDLGATARLYLVQKWASFCKFYGMSHIHVQAKEVPENEFKR